MSKNRVLRYMKLELYGWILLVKSKKQYDELDTFLLKDENYKSLGIDFYALIEGPVRCSDGRALGKEGKKNPILIMNSNGKKVIENMVEEGFADSDSIVLLSDLHEDELIRNPKAPKLVDIKRVEYIKSSKEFEKYL